MATISINKIRMDGGTQTRAAICDQTVAEYAQAILADAVFPAIVVFHDGTDHWLADGFHRVKAYERAERSKIDADVRQGTRRDAILYSVGANGSHGLKRTNEDKRRAVETMLTNDAVLLNDAGQPWADREIARRCGVSAPLVAEVRSKFTVNSYSEGEPRTYTTKHGTVATMNTANIGKREQREPNPAVATLEPEEDLSVGTRFTTPEKPERHRGSYDDGSTILEAIRSIKVSIKEIEGLRPKKTMATSVADEIRSLVTMLQRMITGMEKEY